MTDLRILISRKAGPDLHQLAAQLSWTLTDVETLKIEYLNPEFTDTTTGNETWVVSSRHAAYALAKEYSKHKAICERVVCVGNRTREKLEEKGVPVEIAVISAKALTTAVEDLAIQEVRFFCGTTRRPEIPDAINVLGVPYKEQVVYRSTPLNPIINPQGIDGIVGTSPMSVQSLFNKNDIQPDIPCIAIGQTSMNAMEALGMKNIRVASFPRLETVFTEFNTYLRDGRN